MIEGFCIFRNGLISISDWVFGNVWSCSTLLIMKTSHKSDELNNFLKKGVNKKIAPICVRIRTIVHCVTNNIFLIIVR